MGIRARGFVVLRVSALAVAACFMLISGCGGAGGPSVPEEVLATRGCQRGNPFSCRVLVAEKATQPYKDGMTMKESEAWCLVFKAGSSPPGSSIAYYADTTEGKKWLPAVGGKKKFESLGCPQAAEAAPK